MEIKTILLNGKSEEILAKLKSANIDCILTDPPFGVDNKSNSAVTKAGKEYARKIANDASPEEAIACFQRVMTAVLPKMKPESGIYIFTSQQVLKEWLVMCDDFFSPHGYTRETVGLWEKDGPGMGDLQSWGMGFEFILYYKRGRRERYDERRNLVFRTPQIRPRDLIHPHQKPTGLLAELIKHSTQKGDWICDPFAGSGSTLRAARSVGRNSLGVEFDETNYTLALKKLNEEEEGFDF